MKRFGVPLLILAAVVAQAGPDRKERKKEKSYKGPELEVVIAKAYRTEDLLNIDAKVKNCGVRPIRGLVVLFDFMAPGKLVITSQKIEAEQEVLDPNDEVTFHAQMSDPVRAVQFQLQAVDDDARDLRVAKPGPYPIE
jgi:hypothetical protein